MTEPSTESVRPRRALVYTNPRARQVNTQLDAALDLLREEGLELVFNEPDRDQREGKRNSTEHDWDCLIVAGGDGTLNTMINSMNDLIVKRKLPLGILPLGTANDLARTLHIPTDPVEAARVIMAGHCRTIDLGQANERFFFNVASIGLSEEISRRLSGEMKKRWGVLAYLWTAMQVLRQTRPFRVVVNCDGEVWSGRTVQVAVGNGRFYGGGMTISENAFIDDGRLDLYSLEVRRPWQIFGLARALRKGTLSGRNFVRTSTGVEIHVTPQHVKNVNTDGEITTTTPVTFRVIPNAIRVFTPEFTAGEGTQPERANATPA